MMNKLIFTALMLALASIAAPAQVVRPVPDFGWIDASGKVRSTKQFRGQPMVILIADSARTGRLRSQIDRLEDLYRLFAAKEVVFVAAIRREEDRPVGSNIPFVRAASGEQVARAFGTESKFNIVIVGEDGNVDLRSEDVLTAERVRDIIINSYQQQKDLRS